MIKWKHSTIIWLTGWDELYSEDYTHSWASSDKFNSVGVGWQAATAAA